MTDQLLRGVDLSYVQRVAAGGLIKRVSDNKVLGDIRDFDVVFIKATQGNTIVDSQYANTLALARQFGKKVVAYHFNDNRVDAVAQAQFLLKNAPTADAYALDVEGANAFTDAQAAAFIGTVRANGKKVGYYHSTSGFGAVNADFRWVADYTLAALQDGEPPIAWDVWQFSSKGDPADAGLDLDWVKANGALGTILGLTLVSKAQADAIHAADLQTIADATQTIAAMQAEVASLRASVTDLTTQLAAAPAVERNRIADAEAARIKAL